MRDPILPTKSRQKIVADNRAELDAWIDERVADLVGRGVSPTVARQRALEEFGDLAGAAQYATSQDVAAETKVRVGFWMEELWSDLRIAARTLTRTPTVTGVVLLTFALGIGATTAVFSVVHAMLLRRLPYGAEETLVYLAAADNGVIRPGLGGGRESAAALAALRARTTSFSGIAGVEFGNFILTANGEAEQVTGTDVTVNTFDVLQARPAIGRIFAASDEAGPASQVVILMDGLWRRRFGADSNIVGRTIELSGERYRVVGVMPPRFRVPTYEQAELLVPRGIANLLASPTNSQVRFLRLFARLKPGVSSEAARSDVDRTMRTLRADFPRSFTGVDTRVMPIRTAVAGDARSRLLLLMGAAGFLLLIACANVAGILLSRAVARRHELSVRVALGAGRRRLIRQFLAEGAVLAIAGAGLGLLIAQLGIIALRQIALATLPAGTTFALEPNVLVFAVAAAIATALASALFPALGATRALGPALRQAEQRTSPSRANRRLRLGLVAGQLAVSVVLLVGAGLLLRTLHRLSSLDLGYSTERALTFRLQFTRSATSKVSMANVDPDDRRSVQRWKADQDAFWASIYEQLRAIPSVVSVGGGNIPTTGQSTLSGLAIEGRLVENARLPDVRYTPASDDYFATLGIPIVRGRAFNAGDRDGAPWVAIVSTGLAKQLWPGGDPIGVRVKPAPDKEWATIVGVVGDVRMGGMDGPQPTVYTSQRQDHWPGGGTVVIRARGDPSALTAAIRRVVNGVDPSLPIIGMKTLDDIRQATPAIAERRLQMELMLVFALVALVVSAIGVYGVSAYATEARGQEFGIRLALGASQHGVLWLALRDGVTVAMLGAVVGVPLALVLASRMRPLLFAVEPFDPLTISAVLGALVVVVLAASIVPARRATRIDPARTMRSD